QIGAQQEPVAGDEQLADLAQHSPPRAGWEVADRAPEQSDDPRDSRLGPRNPIEVALEIADHAVHGQLLELVDELDSRRLERALRHVERNVATQGARARHRLEQDSRLLGRARAELDQLAGAGPLHDLAGASEEDLALGASGVVLGELADPLEQLRAPRVIEVLGR